MKGRLIWMIPVLIGVSVGFLLWDMDGFDVNQVMGAWGIIAVMMIVYSVIITSLPTYRDAAKKAGQEKSPVQQNYLDTISSRSVKSR